MWALPACSRWFVQLWCCEPASSSSPLTASSESSNQLRVCVTVWERFTAQQQSVWWGVPVQPLQSGGAQRERVCNMWFPAQDVKSQQGGHLLPIREIKQDRGQSATPISTRGHWTAAAAAPGNSSSSSSSSSYTQGPGARTAQTIGTELIQNQQRKEEH